LPAREDGRPRIRAVAPFETRPNFGLFEQQLHFTWTEAATADVVPLLCRRQQRYLDVGVYDFFRDIPGAASAALGLEKAGIYLLGQLVQLRKADLVILKCVTPKASETIENNLGAVGLGFGMYLPLWNRAAQMRVVL
jgi:hypothetical protein